MSTNAGGLISESRDGYEVLQSTVGLLRGDGIVPANARKVRKGDILSKNASNKFVVTRYTLLAETAATGQPVIVVDDAHAFEVGDTIQVEDEGGTHVIGSIDYDTNEITLTTNLTGERVADKYVKSSTAALATAVAIHIGEDLISRSYDQTIAPAFGGNFKLSKIRNYQTQTKTDLAGTVKSAFDTFSF